MITNEPYKCYPHITEKNFIASNVPKIEKCYLLKYIRLTRYYVAIVKTMRNITCIYRMIENDHFNECGEATKYVILIYAINTCRICAVNIRNTCTTYINECIINLN